MSNLKKKMYNIILFFLLLILISIIVYAINKKNTEENFEDMKFVDENNNLIDINNVEHVEQYLANKFISSDAVVLELGARYGTVSCIISKKLSNPMNLVAVEPDDTVWNALENNMKNNNCKFNIIKGVVNTKKVSLNKDSYASNTTYDVCGNVNIYTFDDIEKNFNLKFNTLVADCEGCIGDLFNENPILYNQLKLIIIEHDFPDKTNYNILVDNFKKFGFKEIEENFDRISRSVWKKNT